MNANTLAERGIQSPFLIEIANLKAALGRYQTAADTANLHLQRQALDSSALAARCTALEQDNALLQAEIQFLRSIPDSVSSTASIQVSELSLALRHVQDNVRLGEEELKSVNEKLGLALKAKTKALYEVEGMEDLVKSTRAREDEWMKRVRDLEGTIRRIEEEKKMVEVCVKEYADLVRGLEGRMSLSAPPLNPPSTNLSTIGLAPPIEEASIIPQDSTSGSGSSGPGSQHSRTSSIQTHSRTGSTVLGLSRPIDSLQEGRLGLQRLLSEFHKQTEKLETEIARLHGELEMMEMQLEQRDRLREENEREIGRLKGELSALGRADRSASMMVEKYMRFSQQSTNLLQTALQTQKQRHAATTSTLHSQIATLNRTIEREQAVSSKLRETLDELTLEISKESYGRRREVSLRLALVERERKIGRTLEWWINTMERGKDSLAGDAGRARAVERARIILHALKGTNPDQEQQHQLNGVGEEEDQRIQAVMLDCEELAKELELETERRMELERRLIQTIGRESRNVSVHNHRQEPSNEEEETTQETPPESSEAEEEDEDEEEELEGQKDRGDSPVQESPSPPEDPENDVALEQQSSSPTDTVSAKEATPEPELELEPDGRFKDIITSLHGTSTRYDALQSSFTDCHNALSELRSSLDSIAHEITAGDVVGNHLVPAVERLDDYCEDARVELEILIADEARIVQGYETLLMVSSSTSREGEANTQFSEGELLKKIDRFVNGTEPSMERARVVFGEKLDNLMHDIVIIKKEMHDRMNGSSMDESDLTKSSPIAVPARLGDHAGAGNLEAISAGNGSGIWKALTSSMLSPPNFTPRSSSPRPVPTFGSLMTSGRPRQPSTHEQSSPDTNPLNRLGLRIATPKFHLAGQSPNSFHFNNIHSPFPFGLTSPDYQAANGGGEVQPNSAPLSRVGSGWLGSGGMVRARTMSSMHSTGFGVGMGMTPKNMTQYGRPASRSGSDAGISLTSGRRRTSGLSNEESGLETRGGDDEIE